MTLLEVLAAIGVLSIGLLGLAALLPVGRIIIAEGTKADRAGNLGRAALRDVIVRRMLDSNPNTSQWTSNPIGSSQSFIIDPEGLTATPPLGNTFAGTTVPRISLKNLNSTALADAVFRATDDLVVTLPEDMIPPGAVGARPTPVFSTVNGASVWNNSGGYSWFLTVTPVPGSTTRFTVAVVVCFGRNLATTGERAVTVTSFFDATPVGPGGVTVALGGGSVQLGTAGTTTATVRPINDIASDKPSNLANIQIKENDWVALCNSQGLCRWYRVAAAGDTSATDTQQFLTLIGPDWVPTPGSDQLVAIGPQVVGVYTTTVELDTDPLWKN